MLEGINDIGMSGVGVMPEDTPVVRAAELIAAYSQIVARAHERRGKVYCGTVLPFEGSAYPACYSEEKEIVREAVNAWMKTAKACDGVIDFDAVVRDPAHTRALQKEYDSGDHLHPNSLGHRKMGDSIDIHLFD